jgi:hypothetical protein
LFAVTSVVTALLTNSSGYYTSAHSLLLQGLYDIGYGTVLDSGTTFTYLPSQAYDQFHQHVSDFALSHGLETIPGPDPRYPDSCFGGAPDASHPDQLKEFFPTVDLYFEVSLSVSHCRP